MVLIFRYYTYIIILQGSMAEVPFWALSCYWIRGETCTHTQTYLEMGSNSLTREYLLGCGFYLQTFCCASLSLCLLICLQAESCCSQQPSWPWRALCCGISDVPLITRSISCWVPAETLQRREKGMLQDESSLCRLSWWLKLYLFTNIKLILHT